MYFRRPPDIQCWAIFIRTRSRYQMLLDTSPGPLEVDTLALEQLHYPNHMFLRGSPPHQFLNVHPISGAPPPHGSLPVFLPSSHACPRSIMSRDRGGQQSCLWLVQKAQGIHPTMRALLTQVHLEPDLRIMDLIPIARARGGIILPSGLVHGPSCPRNTRPCLSGGSDKIEELGFGHSVYLACLFGLTGGDTNYNSGARAIHPQFDATRTSCRLLLFGTYQIKP